MAMQCSYARDSDKGLYHPPYQAISEIQSLVNGLYFVSLSIDAKTASSLMSDILEPSTYLPGLTASNSIAKTTGHLCVSFLYQHRPNTAIIPNN